MSERLECHLVVAEQVMERMDLGCDVDIDLSPEELTRWRALEWVRDARVAKVMRLMARELGYGSFGALSAEQQDNLRNEAEFKIFDWHVVHAEGEGPEPKTRLEHALKDVNEVENRIRGFRFELEEGRYRRRARAGSLKP